MRERFSVGGLVAILASLALIGLGAFFVWKFNLASGITGIWNTTPAVQKEEPAAYLVQDSLPIISTATKNELTEILLGAFRAGKLFSEAEWRIPKRDNAKLVLASPTISGKKEPLSCGIRPHPYCGLYLVTPTSTALIKWGDALIGFNSIERFIDSDHAIVFQSWSFLNYSVIEHKQLDLRTGEIVPLLTLELDLADDSAELQVSGQGKYLSLLISGELEKSRFLPKKLVMRDEYGKTLFAMPDQEMAKLAQASLSGDRKFPVTVKPSDDDIDDARINLLFFGLTYELDVENAKLTMTQTVSK